MNLSPIIQISALPVLNARKHLALSHVTIMLHALNADKDFVQVRLVARSWPAAPQAVGETGDELFAPAPHYLVGDDYTTLSQDQLNMPQASVEDVHSQTA